MNALTQRKNYLTYNMVIFSKTVLITIKWLKSPGDVAQMREYLSVNLLLV